jgi:3-methyladenine DNA glycosylase AlkD
MNVDELTAEVRATCRALADPAQVAKYARYFREGYDGYGVDHRHPQWVTKKQEWLDRLKPLGLKRIIAFGQTLFGSGKYEEGALAIYFVSRLRDQYDRAALRGIQKWFRGGVRNWAHSDILCGEVLKYFWLEGIVTLEELEGWVRSSHKFERRAVPVTLISLLDERRSLGPLLELLRPLMHDGERVVHQGMGWFLREAWKKQPKPVERFLAEYRDTAPRLIFQYATEKMTADQKARFRRPVAKGAAGRQ